MKLHLGGQTAHPDWKILDIEARPEVDFIGDAADLSQFADNSIEAIYASHILEHFHHTLDNELHNTLKEWHRVLQPGGQLFLSVPDLQILCWMFLCPSLSVQDRYFVMQVIFGGQGNLYDVHRVGFDASILELELQKAGFSSAVRSGNFDLFADGSTMKVMGVPISLNLIVSK